MEEKYFTTEQVAHILQVHPFTILKFIREDKLPGIKLGRMYRIKGSDVEQFLESRITGSKKQKEEKIEKEHKKEHKEDSKVIYKVKQGDDEGEQQNHYYII